MLAVFSVSVTPELVELDVVPGLMQNEQFDVNFHFSDIRATPQAVLSGYADVNFDPAKFRVDEIRNNDKYPSGKTGTIDNPAGLVNEVGAFDGTSPPTSDVVFTLRMTAIGSGVSTITTDAGEDGTSEITVLGSDDDQRPTTDFGSLQLTVTAPPPTVQFTAATQTGPASNGVMTITAELSAATTNAVTVPFVVTGTATSPADYTITPSPITIEAGQTQGTITVNLVNDTLDEADETIIATLGVPTNATLGTTVVHTATIVDNDPAPTVQFTAASQDAAENAGTATVTVALSEASGQVVTVPFTVTGTAIDPADYTIAPNPIAIAPGQTNATVTIIVVDDALDEIDETVVLTLGTPAGATLAAANVHTATILDNDLPPTVQFTAASQSGLENAGALIITAQLSGASGQAVTVPFTVTGTATAPDDYTITPSPINIAPGQTAAVVTITVVDDTLLEDDETVVVTMGTPTNATLGATTVHTATILANDGGDGLSVYDPTSSVWFIRNTADFGDPEKVFGFGAPGAGWQPVFGDWNNDGVDTAGLYDPSSSVWYLSNGEGTTDVIAGFGPAGAGWKPIVGDWDGDGFDTLGLYDPKASTFYLTNSLGGNPNAIFGYGAPDAGWMPVAGDWNADGKDTIGLYDPASSWWFLRNTNDMGNADSFFGYGQADAGWSPIAGDWNSDGTDTIGLHDAGASVWYLRNANDMGGADAAIPFGAPDSGWRASRGTSDLLSQIIDDGARSDIAGEWTSIAGTGFRGDACRSEAGDGIDTVTWDFWVLPGQYTVAATWGSAADQAFFAPLTVADGNTPLDTVYVNEWAPPADFNEQGAPWKNLGTFSVTGNHLVVTLADDTMRPVLADAIHIERVSPLAAAGVEAWKAAQSADEVFADDSWELD